MPTFRCEFFGHFIFAEELSYADLLAKETRLREALSELFAQADFSHLNFTSTGDFLLMQAVVAEHDQDLCQEICAAIHPLLDAGVEARLLFVDRFLDSVFFYALNSETWRESVLEWPLPKQALATIASPDPPAPVLKRKRP